MKEQDDMLTLPEIEQLCRLYMDCNLSVLEEAELRYLLTQVDYHSPLIDETRRIMDIDAYISGKPFIKVGSRRKSLFRRWAPYMGVAASIVLVMSIGFSLLKPSSHDAVESHSYNIAYVDGQRLSDEAAKIEIEAEKKLADDFIKEMSELEARKQQMIDDFFNL